MRKPDHISKNYLMGFPNYIESQPVSVYGINYLFYVKAIFCLFLSVWYMGNGIAITSFFVYSYDSKRGKGMAELRAYNEGKNVSI